jgi:glycosyltransferase involved in cell wall biosynthesis
MKFGFVVTNLAGGGAEKVILNIGAALRARGHEVHLVLLEDIVEHTVPNTLTIHPLSQPKKRISRGALGKRLAARRLRRAMAALARPRPFDIVISTLPFADEIAILADLPRHWCRIANTLSIEIARLRQTAPGKAVRRLARYRRLYGGRPLIAVSQGVVDDLRDSLGLTNVPIERVYNPFDFLAIRKLAREPANLPGRPYAIHVGRFAAQKRHDLLLDAWARPGTASHRLVLLTEPAAALRDMIAARGLVDRVFVAGFQPNPYPWIAAADVLVLCSDHEGLPNVLIEALILGTPVVSTDCPSGPREILGDAFPGALVPVNNAELLAQAIARTLADRPDMDRIDLSLYDADIVAAMYERLAEHPRGHSDARSGTA